MPNIPPKDFCYHSNSTKNHFRHPAPISQSLTKKCCSAISNAANRSRYPVPIYNIIMTKSRGIHFTFSHSNYSYNKSKLYYPPQRHWLPYPSPILNLREILTQVVSQHNSLWQF